MLMFENALRVVAAVVICGIVTCPSPVRAGEVRVMISDLNLHSDKGVATLHERIAHAAKVVCGPVDIKSTQAVYAYNLCHDAALASARPKAEALVAASRSGTAVASNAITVAP